MNELEDFEGTGGWRTATDQDLLNARRLDPENDSNFVMDTARDLGRLGIGLVDTAVGLGDLVYTNITGESGRGALKEHLGYDPNKWIADLNAQDSFARQDSRAAYDRAEGFVDSAAALISNPRELFGQIVQNLPNIYGMTAAAKGAAKYGLKKGMEKGLEGKALQDYARGYALAASSAAEGALTTGSVASAIADEKLSKGEVADRADMNMALAAGAGTAVIGRGMAKFGGGVEAALGQRLANGAIGETFENVAGRNMFTRTGKAFLAEGGEEALQSGQEEIFTNIGADNQWNEGIGKAMGSGFVLGGAMGGGMHALHGTMDNVQRALSKKATDQQNILPDANQTAEAQAAEKAGMQSAIADEQAMQQKRDLDYQQGLAMLGQDHDTATHGGIPMIEGVEHAKSIHDGTGQLEPQPDYIYNDVTRQQEEALRQEQAIKAQQAAEKQAAIEKERAEKKAAKDAEKVAKQAEKDAEKAKKDAPSAFSQRASVLGYNSPDPKKRTAKSNDKAYDEATQEEKDFIELAISEALADSSLGKVDDTRIGDLFNTVKGRIPAGSKTAGVKAFINNMGLASGKGSGAKNKLFARLKKTVSGLGNEDNAISSYVEAAAAKRANETTISQTPPNNQVNAATNAANNIDDGESFAIEPRTEVRTQAKEFDDAGNFKGVSFTVSSEYDNVLKNRAVLGQNKASYSDALTIDDIEKHVDALASGTLSDLKTYSDKLNTDAVKQYTSSIRQEGGRKTAIAEEVITQATKHGAKYSSLDNVLGNMAAKLSRDSLGMAYNRLLKKAGKKPSPVAKHSLEYLRAKLELREPTAATQELEKAFNPPLDANADKDVLHYFGTPLERIGAKDTTHESLMDALNREKGTRVEDVLPFTEEEISAANAQVAKYMRSVNATHARIESGDYALMVINTGDSNFGRLDEKTGAQKPLFALSKRKEDANGNRRADKTNWKVFSYANGHPASNEDAADAFMAYARHQIRRVKGQQKDALIDDEIDSNELVNDAGGEKLVAYGLSDEETNELDREYSAAQDIEDEAEADNKGVDNTLKTYANARGYDFGVLPNVKTAGKDQTAGDGYVAKVLKSGATLESMLNTPELKNSGANATAKDSTATTTRKLAPTLDEVIKQATVAFDDAIKYYFYETYKKLTDDLGAEAFSGVHAPKGNFRAFFEKADQHNALNFFSGFLDNPPFDEVYKPASGDKPAQYPVIKMESAEGDVRVSILGEVAKQFGVMLNYSARSASERTLIAEAIIEHFSNPANHYVPAFVTNKLVSDLTLDEAAQREYNRYEDNRLLAANKMLTKMKTTVRNGLRVGMSKTQVPMSWRSQDDKGKAYGVSDGGGDYTTRAMRNWGNYVWNKFDQAHPGVAIVSVPIAERITFYNNLLKNEKLNLRFNKSFTAAAPTGEYKFHDGGSYARNWARVQDFTPSDLWLAPWVEASGLFTREEVRVSALLNAGKDVRGDSKVGSSVLGAHMLAATTDYDTRAFGIQDEDVSDVEFDRWADASGGAVGSISADQANEDAQRRAAEYKGAWHANMVALKGALSRIITPAKIKEITSQLEANVASWTDLRAAQFLFEYADAGRVKDMRSENAMSLYELSGADTEAIKQGGDEVFDAERARLAEYLEFESEVFRSYYMDNVSADAAQGDFNKVHKDVGQCLENLAKIRFFAVMRGVFNKDINKWADEMHSRKLANNQRIVSAGNSANTLAVTHIENVAGSLNIAKAEEASTMKEKLQEATSSSEGAKAKRMLKNISKSAKGDNAKTVGYRLARDIVTDVLGSLYTEQGFLDANRSIKWALSNYVEELMAMKPAERNYTRQYMAALYKAAIEDAVVRGMLSSSAADRVSRDTKIASEGGVPSDPLERSIIKGMPHRADADTKQIIRSRAESLFSKHAYLLDETLSAVEDLSKLATAKSFLKLAQRNKDRVIASVQEDLRATASFTISEVLDCRVPRYNLAKSDNANIRQLIHQLFQRAIDAFNTNVRGSFVEKLAAKEIGRMERNAEFREKGMKAGEALSKPLTFQDFIGFIRNPTNALARGETSEATEVFQVGKQIKAAEKQGVYKRAASNSVYHGKGIKYGVEDILKRNLPPKERLMFIRDYVSNPAMATRAMPVNQLEADTVFDAYTPSNAGQKKRLTEKQALDRAVQAAIDSFHEKEKQQANRRLPNSRNLAMENKGTVIPTPVISPKAILDYAKHPGKRLDEMSERDPNRVVVEQAKLRMIAAGMTEEAADAFFSDIMFRERHPEDNTSGSIKQYNNGVQIIMQESFISIGKRLFYCTHELAHKLFGDTSAYKQGEAACQRPEMEFRIVDGKLEAVGAAAKQLLELAANHPVLTRLCRYPLAADMTKGPYNNPAHIGKELLAQIGAVYLHHPAYAEVINREAPDVGKLIQEYINKQNGGSNNDPGTGTRRNDRGGEGDSSGESVTVSSPTVLGRGSGGVGGGSDSPSPSPNGSSGGPGGNGPAARGGSNRDSELGSGLGSDGTGRNAEEVTSYAMESTPAQRAVDSAVTNAVQPSKPASYVENAIARLPEWMQGYAKKAVSALRGLNSDTTKQFLLGMSFTENLAERVKETMPAVKTWVAKRMEKEAWQNMQLELLARFKNRAAGFSEELRAQTNSVIEQATLTRAWPYRPSWMDDATWRKHTTDKSTRQAHEEAKAKFDALPAEAQQYVKDLFAQTHAFHQNRVDAMEAQTKDTFEKAIEATVGEGKATLREHYEQAKKLIHSFRSNGNWPYAPLDRQGTHAVVARSVEFQKAMDDRDELYAQMKKNPSKFSEADTIKLRKLNKQVDEMKTDGSHYMVAFANSQAEANLMRDSFVASNPGMDVQAYPRLEAQKGQKLSFLNIGLIEDALYQRLDHTETIGEQRKYITQMLTALNDIYISSLAEDHARKTDMRRQGVAGYNKDMINNFLTQGKREVHYVANVKFAKELRNARNDMLEQAQKARTQEERENSQRVVRELIRREELDFDYRPSDTIDAIQRFNSVWMLMLSPGYYLQNATQSFMMSAPLMCGDYNASRVFKDLGRNTMELAKAFLNKDYRLGDSPDFRKMKFMDKDCYLALQKARANNRLDVGMAQDFGDLDSGGVWQRITDHLSNFSRTAELLNRVAAFKTAFELRREECLNKGMSREESNENAYEYADKIMRESHGNYGASNEPRFFKRNGTPLGNAGKLVFQFRKFQLIQLGMMYRLAKASAADVNSIKDEAERAVARRALLHVLGVHMAMTGLKGTPFAMAMLGFMSLFGAEGDDDEDVIRKFVGNKALSDLLLEGVPSLMGVDLSGRLGAANMLSPFPFLSANPLDGRAEAQDALVATLGPTASQAVKLMQGMGMLLDGDVQKGFEKLAPTALANISKAWRFQMEGYTTQNGTVAIPAEEFSAMDSFMQVIGFPTKLTTDKFRLQSKLTRTEAEFNKEENQLNKEFREAAGDRAERMRIQREYVELQKRRAAAGFKPKAATQLIKNEKRVLKDEANAKAGLIVKSTERGWVDIWSKL